MNSERGRRCVAGTVFVGIALIAIIVGYIFFLNRGDLTLADIFNNLGSILVGSLLGVVISALVAVFFGSAAVGKIYHPSGVEQCNMFRRRVIENILLSEGYKMKEWRRAKAKVKND